MKLIKALVILVFFLPSLCLAQSCPQKIYTFDSSFESGLIEGQYLGKQRNIQYEKNKFIDLAKTAFPDIKNILNLYKREISIKTSSGEKLWLPIQEQVFQKFKTDVDLKVNISFYCRNLGSIDNEQVIVIIDYKKASKQELL